MRNMRQGTSYRLQCQPCQQPHAQALDAKSSARPCSVKRADQAHAGLHPVYQVREDIKTCFLITGYNMSVIQKPGSISRAFVVSERMKPSATILTVFVLQSPVIFKS